MITFKEYLLEKDPCWKKYKQLGMKKKDGEEVPNCIPEEVDEATYQGKEVPLNKPMMDPDGPKKRKVYVKNEKGNIVKVTFGQKGVKIKKDNPERRKSFRARHNCEEPGPTDKAKYWSCKMW